MDHNKAKGSFRYAQAQRYETRGFNDAEARGDSSFGLDSA